MDMIEVGVNARETFGADKLLLEKAAIRLSELDMPFWGNIAQSEIICHFECIWVYLLNKFNENTGYIPNIFGRLLKQK